MKTETSGFFMVFNLIVPFHLQKGKNLPPSKPYLWKSLTKKNGDCSVYRAAMATVARPLPAFKCYYMKCSFYPPGNADLIFVRLLSFIFSVKRREVICQEFRAVIMDRGSCLRESSKMKCK